MDPYDAILEQLKRAQTRGVEAVTNRLDFVKESLDELIQEAKSSVEEAVPQEAEELFPIAELVASIGELRGRAQTAESVARELELQVSALKEQLAGQPEQEASGVSLDVLRRLDAPRSQSELLRELLPAIVEHVGRAAVLVIRGSSISAWSGIGFVDSERLRSWQGELESSPVLSRFASDSTPVRFTPTGDELFRSWLGDEPSTEACLLPVCLRGKVMGAIYADRIDDRPWQPESAQAMVALTCWLIDTLHYRQAVPSPMLAEPQELTDEVEPVAAEQGEASEAPLPAAVALEAGAPEPEEVEPVTAAVEVEAVADEAPSPTADDLELEGEPPAGAASFDPSATVRVDVPPPPVPEPVSEPVPVPEPEPAPEPPPEPVEEPQAPPAVQPVTPPVEPVTPPEEPAGPPEDAAAALSPEEEARHEEARRFARLLVSEIKLYNEDEVDRGRANADLYFRLKEDIDRSREMYEKRIAPEIRETHDYFNDELVRILADGNADALGM